jgi:hypothetical protein
MWVDGRGWTNAGDLRIGDRLSRYDGSTATITAISERPGPVTVYNFEVEGDHNYYVTEAQLLVHNCAVNGRSFWNVTRERADKGVSHPQFGNILRSKSDGLWWSRDKAGHGGSTWKVFKEESGGLRWYRDADEYGDFISGKHKGQTGEFIPWSQVSGLF